MNAVTTHDGNVVVRLDARTPTLDRGLKALRDLAESKPTIAHLLCEYFDRDGAEPFISSCETRAGRLTVSVTPSDELWTFLRAAGATDADLKTITQAFGGEQ